MKIQFWSIGKDHEKFIQIGLDNFTRRINHYFTAEWKLFNLGRSLSGLDAASIIRKEGELILAQLKKEDLLVCLDERGKMMDSKALAKYLQGKANVGTRNLVFLIGGAYGMDEQVWKRADLVWSLSPLTFPHQLVRLILAEQVYRACTIMRNEQYHH